MYSTSICWFRRDLRIQDNPALDFARNNSEKIIPIYIHDNFTDNEWSEGSATKWWLHHSLLSLKQSLIKKGSNLIVRKGDPLEILSKVIDESGASLVCWNRMYEPIIIERDKNIKSHLKDKGLSIESFNGSYLLDPWECKNKTGKPYQVFTPFWKNLQNLVPEKIKQKEFKSLPELTQIESLAIEDLELLPKIKWDKDFYHNCEPGEQGAHKCLNKFLKKIDVYKNERDYPSIEANSRLSAHLHFGEIHPLEIWRITEDAFKKGEVSLIEPFLRQLGWREFANHLLFHFPHTTKEPLRTEFKKFPWGTNKKYLNAWQKGLTGYPIIDAGMRELWSTGIMHNRVRMIVGSFLVKNLLIHWHQGAKWFWDTLVDADLANNTLGWQWVAGSGADAAPYFRIFHPVTQSEKFDPAGAYLKKWVPELSSLPSKIIHAPWLASEETLSAYDITLGKTYPRPIVCLKETREQALEAYQTIRRKL